jgi:hypothetical protein
MYSVPRSILAVAVFTMSSLSGTVAFPQTVKFIRRAADPLPFVNLSPGPAPCVRDSGGMVSAPRAATPANGDAGSPCDTPAVSVPSVNPCNPASPTQIGCSVSKDSVKENLATMGKPGQKILRARDRVLEILQTENACSAWFREKDANAAATFQTLGYAVDRHGEDLIHMSKDTDSQYIFRDPYVARVGQDTGAFATITLNAGGAFFHAQATTLAVSREGGLSRIGSPRLMNIGPYPGDTAAGQTLALLHEFGHVVNLLPVDFDNEDGKSVRNTAEVLRFCRAELESKVKGGSLSVAR